MEMKTTMSNMIAEKEKQETDLRTSKQLRFETPEEQSSLKGEKSSALTRGWMVLSISRNTPTKEGGEKEVKQAMIPRAVIMLGSKEPHTAVRDGLAWKVYKPGRCGQCGKEIFHSCWQGRKIDRPAGLRNDPTGIVNN